MDPDHEYSLGYLAENRGQELLDIAIVFAVLETLFIVLYFASRFVGKTIKRIDVYLMLPAYIMCISQIAASFVQVRYAGVGRHVVAVTKTEITILLKSVVFEQFTYPVAITLPKLSILCLYLRVFPVRSFRYTTYAIIGVVIITYWTTFILTFTLCTPFAYNWNKTIPGGHCRDSNAAYRYISVPNIITDLAMLILPLPVIWNLHASRMQKTGLTITFLAGSVGIIVAILRLVVFITVDFAKDLPWYWVETHTWLIVEPGVYLIAACLLSLRPLLKHTFKDVDFGTIYARIYARLLGYMTRVSTFSKTKDISLSAVSTSRTDPGAERGPRSGFIRLYDTHRKGNSGPEKDGFVVSGRNDEYDSSGVQFVHYADVERG